MKTAELEGALLDYWVARAEGRKLEMRDGEWFVANNAGDWMFELLFYKPSSEWMHGGPIIERERIDISARGFSVCRWGARVYGSSRTKFWAAHTPLIAAMRAYVASRFGDEVPEQAA